MERATHRTRSESRLKLAYGAEGLVLSISWPLPVTKQCATSKAGASLTDGLPGALKI